MALLGWIAITVHGKILVGENFGELYTYGYKAIGEENFNEVSSYAKYSFGTPVNIGEERFGK